MCGSCTKAQIVPPVTHKIIDRRAFLLGGLSFAAVCLTPGMCKSASLAGSGSNRYVLWLERMQTGERVAAPFTLNGKSLYVPGYAQLCAILRDEHVSLAAGYVQISVRTIEALWAVQKYLVRNGVDEPIIVHSGYRTPQTNARTEGAASQSLHMYGMAVDFHVPGVAMDYLAQICMACTASGGVGYYPDGWVHLDTGPKRYWTG